MAAIDVIVDVDPHPRASWRCHWGMHARCAFWKNRRALRQISRPPSWVKEVSKDNDCIHINFSASASSVTGIWRRAGAASRGAGFADYGSGFAGPSSARGEECMSQHCRSRRARFRRRPRKGVPFGLKARVFGIAPGEAIEVVCAVKIAVEAGAGSREALVRVLTHGNALYAMLTTLSRAR